MHPVREHPSEADLIAVAKATGLLPNLEAVHGRPIPASEVRHMRGAALTENFRVLA
jgi:hypothetical protein